MSLRLPGKARAERARIVTVTPVLGFLLFFSLAFPAAGEDAPPEGKAAEKQERVSGVVKPVVTILKPKTRGGDKPLIEEYSLPKEYCAPYGLGEDSKGRLWLTEMAGNSLAVFDPSTKELKEYRIPSTKGLPETDWKYDPKDRKTPEEVVNVYSVGGPANLIVDQNDIVWFVMHLGNSVVRFDPEKEEFTEFLIPTDNALPYDLAADSKGRIWFIEKNSGKLAYLDYANEKMYEVEVGKGANMMGITVDKDDNVWIGDVTSNVIGRYDPETKKLKPFPINVPTSQPGQMRFGENGYLWICHLHSQHLGVLIPDPGVHSVVPLPGYNAVPQGIYPGSENKIWMVDSMTNHIGFFDSVNLKWRLFPIPTADSQPMNVIQAANGDIWFTESGRHANAIARLVPSTIPPEEEEKPAVATEAMAEGGAQQAAGGSGESLSTRTYVAGVVLLLAALAGVFMFLKVRSKQ